MITVAIIGIGQRGRVYADVIKKRKDAKVVAICDKNEKLLRGMGEVYGVPSEKLYVSDEEFFKAGKLADALIVSTMDRDHYGHAKAGLNLGYHLLLEKPVSPVFSEVEELERLAREKNLKVVVCHVLRYSPFYNAIKDVLESGEIGKVVNTMHSENVAYWHFMHSYVRGNWKSEEETAPSLLAKCCHDFDILYWFKGQKFKRITSHGSLEFFKKENAPEGATERCFDCPHLKTCPYSCDKDYYKVSRYTFPYFCVMWKIITGLPKPTLKDVKESLKTSDYGKCVFLSNNDVYDNHTTLIEFEDGTTACMNMQAFSKKMQRRIHIYGTRGEIIGNDSDGKFRVNVFGGRCHTVKVHNNGLGGHLGGDGGIIIDFIDYVANNRASSRLTTLTESLESHRGVLESCAYDKKLKEQDK